MTQNQRIAWMVRQNHGIEILPDEVDSITREGLAKIRRALGARGYEVPASDEELGPLVAQALRAVGR